MDLKERAPATDQPESTEQSLNLLDQKVSLIPEKKLSHFDSSCLRSHRHRHRNHSTHHHQKIIY